MELTPRTIEKYETSRRNNKRNIRRHAWINAGFPNHAQIRVRRVPFN